MTRLPRRARWAHAVWVCTFGVAATVAAPAVMADASTTESVAFSASPGPPTAAASLAAPASPQETTTPAHAAEVSAASTPPWVAPTVVDTVERGLRLRVDGWGRGATVLAPAPPVRFEVDEADGDSTDADVAGLVIFGWDRPYGAPVAADILGTVTGDVFGDSSASAFLDDTSLAPRAQLYSAFVALSAAPGELLAPFTLRVGRMTEMATAPITFDGIAAGGRFDGAPWGTVRAHVWGGLDAPQRLAADPFSRVDLKSYSEVLVDRSASVSPTGAQSVERRTVDADGDGQPDPTLNGVGGLNVDGQILGVGFRLAHTLLPTVQRSLIDAHRSFETELVTVDVGADLTVSDFLPRHAGIRGDLMSTDGATRMDARVGLQFLEDVCAYDCTWRAFNPVAQLVASGARTVENARIRDQIRHLNIGPPQEHIAAVVDVEHLLPWGMSASLRGRLRQHFDDADLDAFRTNVVEGGIGLAWANLETGRRETGRPENGHMDGVGADTSPTDTPLMTTRTTLEASHLTPSLNAGADVLLGRLDSGRQLPFGFDLLAEGVTHYVEARVHMRAAWLDGRLSQLAEVFVRRQDIQTRAYLAVGQWSGAVAATLRYDVTDAWSVSARLDADALAPIDALNGSGFAAALVGTALRL